MQIIQENDKHKEETLSKSELKLSNGSKESLTVDKIVTISNKKLTIDKSGTRSTIKGEQIAIDGKGNITCRNCEVEQEKQNDIKRSQDSSAFSNSNIEYSKEADLKIHDSCKNTFRKEDKVSKLERYNFWNYWSNYIDGIFDLG